MSPHNKKVNGFTLQYKIGQGGMAEVWYAENKIGKAAAVKILKEEYCKMQDLITRFENEAKIMVKLQHSAIRQVMDFEFINNRPCIIMEYLDGDDMKAVIKQGKDISNIDIINYWNQCVEALNYTHQKGVVHRDIKPSNIFITKDNKIKILDYGIAKVKDSMCLTQTGTHMGTLLYMSPEQVKDSKHLNYKTDIYSLAVTFYHLLKKDAPYDSDSSSAFDIQNKIVREDLDMSILPQAWQSFLPQFLKKEAQDRADLVLFPNVNTKNEEKSSFDRDETLICPPTAPPSVNISETKLIKKEDETQSVPITSSNKTEVLLNKKKNKLLFILFGIAASLLIAVFIWQPWESRENSSYDDRNDGVEEEIAEEADEILIDSVETVEEEEEEEEVNNPTNTIGSGVTDYDGNWYPSIVLGNQEWMAKNLKVTHYPNGNSIPYVTGDNAWADLKDNNTDDAYCYYDDNLYNASTYGALYTYAAAKKACPSGWHLPTNAEWDVLKNYLGSSNSASKMAGNKGLWRSDNLTKNSNFSSSGFNALPSGGRCGYDGGVLSFLGDDGNWWSATEYGSSSAFFSYVNYYSTILGQYYYNGSSGFSVRCVRD